MTEITKDIDGYNVIEYEKSNIYVIENILDHDLCNDFRTLIDKLPLNKIDYFNGNNVKCYSINNDELKNTNDDSYYTFSTDVNEYNKLIQKITDKQSISTNKLNGITKNEIEEYSNIINNKMKKIQDILIKVNPEITFEFNTGYIYRKIYGPTRLHTDGVTEIYNSNITCINNNKLGTYNMIRNASIIFALNDDFEGGIIKFPYYDISIKFKKGSVILFPPYWTHRHEVTELQNNTYRYTINTWSCIKI